MKELKLKDADYQQIADDVHREFIEKNVGKRLFLCKCYVKSFIGWLHSKGYKIVKNED